MGRNKDLRKKIAGHRRVIELHEEKIRQQRSKEHPDEDLVAGWLDEIAKHKKAIEHLGRRLKREW
jgi:hypothetical protein